MPLAVGLRVTTTADLWVGMASQSAHVAAGQVWGATNAVGSGGGDAGRALREAIHLRITEQHSRCSWGRAHRSSEVGGKRRRLHWQETQEV